MKVYLGKYIKWIGPYQLADMIPFISKDTSEKIGYWLNETWVDNICQWFYDKRKRKVSVRIDPYDTWNMDDTLAIIILPMLKQIKQNKVGSQLVDDEDLPSHMRHTLSKGPDDYETDDHWIHYKWEWVLNEMIWTFEHIIDEDWEDQFRHGTAEYIFEDEEIDTELGEKLTVSRMIQKNPNYWVDYDKIKEYNNRIDNGLRLFGKYYRGLWD